VGGARGKAGRPEGGGEQGGRALEGMEMLTVIVVGLQPIFICAAQST